MSVLFLCKRTCIDHFQEHVIRYVYMFKDPDPVLILKLAIGINQVLRPESHFLAALAEDIVLRPGTARISPILCHNSSHAKPNELESHHNIYRGWAVDSNSSLRNRGVNTIFRKTGVAIEDVGSSRTECAYCVSLVL